MSAKLQKKLRFIAFTRQFDILNRKKNAMFATRLINNSAFA